MFFKRFQPVLPSSEISSSSFCVKFAESLFFFARFFQDMLYIRKNFCIPGKISDTGRAKNPFKEPRKSSNDNDRKFLHVQKVRQDKTGMAF